MTLRLNGSTSGYVEIDAPATAGSNTLVLPTGNGTSGQYLQTNGSGALSWAAGGKILQVVQGTSATAVVNNTNTYTDSGLTASITPASTSSKILVAASVPYGFGTNNGSLEINFNIIRGSTSVYETASWNNVSAIVQLYLTASFCYLDSPSTTSSTTYKVQFKERYAGNRYGNTQVMPVNLTQPTGTIILMEVAA